MSEPPTQLVDPTLHAPGSPVGHALPLSGLPSSIMPSQSLSLLSQSSFGIGLQTHAPDAGSHVGLRPVQSASLRHSTHVFGVRGISQKGVVPPQSASLTHP